MLLWTLLLFSHPHLGLQIFLGGLTSVIFLPASDRRHAESPFTLSNLPIGNNKENSYIGRGGLDNSVQRRKRFTKI